MLQVFLVLAVVKHQPVGSVPLHASDSPAGTPYGCVVANKSRPNAKPEQPHGPFRGTCLAALGSQDTWLSLLKASLVGPAILPSLLPLASKRAALTDLPEIKLMPWPPCHRAGRSSAELTTAQTSCPLTNFITSCLQGAPLPPSLGHRAPIGQCTALPWTSRSPSHGASRPVHEAVRQPACHWPAARHTRNHPRTSPSRGHHPNRPLPCLSIHTLLEMRETLAHHGQSSSSSTCSSWIPTETRRLRHHRTSPNRSHSRNPWEPEVHEIALYIYCHFLTKQTRYM